MINPIIKHYLNSFAPYRKGRREYGSVQCALQTLNDSLGTNYQLNRLYEWLNQTRPVPRKVADFISAYNIED